MHQSGGSVFGIIANDGDLIVGIGFQRCVYVLVSFEGRDLAVSEANDGVG